MNSAASRFVTPATTPGSPPRKLTVKATILGPAGPAVSDFMTSVMSLRRRATRRSAGTRARSRG